MSINISDDVIGNRPRCIHSLDVAWFCHSRKQKRLQNMKIGLKMSLMGLLAFSLVSFAADANGNSEEADLPMAGMLKPTVYIVYGKVLFFWQKQACC